MKDRCIKKIIPRYFIVPLEEPLVDAEHGAQKNFELITVTIELNDGSVGVGYSYTGGFGGKAILSMIHQDFIPYLIGKDASAVETLTDSLAYRVNYVGRGGISCFAVSAVDIALWDLRTRSAGLPLWKFLGGEGKDVDCYYGGIDLGYSLDRLVRNIASQGEKGHRAFKIKVGKKDLFEDIERIEAIRAQINAKGVLMVDANASWSLGRTLQALPELVRSNVFWLEEPMECRSWDQYEKLSLVSTIPIAMGENLHTLIQHRQALQYGGVSFIQPDASNVCGITGWLRIAALARAFGVPVCSHGMQELHVSLLSAMTNSGYMEIHCFPIENYTVSPVKISYGKASVPTGNGTGVEFQWDLLDSFEQKVPW